MRHGILLLKEKEGARQKATIYKVGEAGALTIEEEGAVTSATTQIATISLTHLNLTFFLSIS